MYVTINWPGPGTLPVPNTTYTEVLSHLLEGFESEPLARQYWEDIPSVLIFLGPEDDPKTATEMTDELKHQIHFALTYPEYVVAINDEFLLVLAIFSDEGAGIYLLIHRSNPLALELNHD